jgi:hypothetical protein
MGRGQNRAHKIGRMPKGQPIPIGVPLQVRVTPQLWKELDAMFAEAKEDDPELSWSRFIRATLRIGLRARQMAANRSAKLTGIARE